MTTKYYHLRLYSNLVDYDIDPRGGATFAYEYDAEKDKLIYAYCKCNEDDNYNKRTGRIKAKARLESLSVIGSREFVGIKTLSNTSLYGRTSNKEDFINIFNEIYINNQKEYWSDVRDFIVRARTHAN